MPKRNRYTSPQHEKQMDEAVGCLFTMAVFVVIFIGAGIVVLVTR